MASGRGVNATGEGEVAVERSREDVEVNDRAVPMAGQVDDDSHGGGVFVAGDDQLTRNDQRRSRASSKNVQT